MIITIIMTLLPLFTGDVLLDHRTVHLLECVDKKSEALFNKIVRYIHSNIVNIIYYHHGTTIIIMSQL